MRDAFFLVFEQCGYDMWIESHPNLWSAINAKIFCPLNVHTMDGHSLFELQIISGM
jgi:hypothetical protein